MKHKRENDLIWESLNTGEAGEKVAVYLNTKWVADWIYPYKPGTHVGLFSTKYPGMAKELVGEMGENDPRAKVMEKLGPWKFPLTFEEFDWFAKSYKNHDSGTSGLVGVGNNSRGFKKERTVRSKL